MKTFQFGQIVLLGFPHTDGNSISKRPALVLFDAGDDDVIVCRITSRIHHTEFDIPVVPAISNGLMVASVIRVHKMATLAKTIIIRVIGQIKENERSEVHHAFHLLVKG
jgi:mRNA interferase MazF